MHSKYGKDGDHLSGRRSPVTPILIGWEILAQLALLCHESPIREKPAAVVWLTFTALCLEGTVANNVKKYLY